jgi:hypothetical protein
MASRREFVGACVFGAVSAVAAKSNGEETEPGVGKPAVGQSVVGKAGPGESSQPAVAVQTHSADLSAKLPTPAVKDADAAIRAAMREHWSKPERLLWRIVYHPIKGLSDHSQWHIAGTHWWVRLNPGWVKLDEFDKAKTYEIDAVALDQNYGVIDFYVYEKRIVT